MVCLQREYLCCYLFVVTLLKSLRCGSPVARPAPAALDVGQPATATPCSDVTDDVIDDVTFAAESGDHVCFATTRTANECDLNG